MSDSENDTPDKLTRRIRRDGSVEPLSLEDQWQQMEKWRRFLETKRGEPDSTLASLINAWESMDAEFNPNNEWNIERGEKIRHNSGSALGAMAHFLEMGLYPPPELLLTITDCWYCYVESAGHISLDEAFLGKPKKSSGNYAKQRRTEFRKFRITFDFIQLLKEGKSRIEAAEIVSQRLGGKPDADSVLRLLRGIGPGSFGRRKAEK